MSWAAPAAATPSSSAAAASGSFRSLLDRPDPAVSDFTIFKVVVRRLEHHRHLRHQHAADLERHWAARSPAPALSAPTPMRFPSWSPMAARWSPASPRRPDAYGSPGTAMTVTGNLDIQFRGNLSGQSQLRRPLPLPPSPARLRSTALVLGNLNAGRLQRQHQIHHSRRRQHHRQLHRLRKRQCTGLHRHADEVGDPQLQLQLVADIGQRRQSETSRTSPTRINNFFNSGGTVPAAFFPVFEANPAPRSASSPARPRPERS